MTKKETLGSLVVLAAALYLFTALITQLAGSFKSEPFQPLESRPFFLTEGQAYQAGEQFEVRNGICNNGDEPILVDVFLGMQRDLSDGVQQPGLEGASVIPVIGTTEEPEQLILFPGCVGTQPLHITIPSEVMPGTYHLFLRATTQSDTGEEQREVLTSQAFEVTGVDADGP